MGAPGETKGTRFEANGVSARVATATTTTVETPIAASVKTAIVDLLLMLPDSMQRPAAAVVRAVWPGFRSA